MSKLLEAVEAQESVTKFYQLKWEIIEELKKSEAEHLLLLRLEQQTSLVDFFRMKTEIIEALKNVMVPKKGKVKEEKILER